MGIFSPIITEFINNASTFAQPILLYIREQVHKHCPDVTEAIKWGHIIYMYKGKNICSTVCFKNHAAFGFWQHKLMLEQFPWLADKAENTMFAFGKLTSTKDLPTPKVLKQLISYTMYIVDNKVVVPKIKNSKNEVLIETPLELEVLLKKNKDAHQAFYTFSNSCRKEYIQWILDAKKTETKQKRMEQTVNQCAEGKQMHWKYNK